MKHMSEKLGLSPVLVSYLSIVFFFCLAIRLISVTGTFFTDEGWYEGISFFTFSNMSSGAITSNVVHPPHSTHTMSLYPILLSPLWFIPELAIFLSRITDSLFMASGMVMFMLFLRRLSSSVAAFIGSLLLTLLLNHPDFVNSGMKNAFAPALLFLNTSLYLSIASGHSRRAVLLGGSVALSILFRESFAPFLLPISLLAKYEGKYSLREFFITILSGAITATVIVLSLARLRSPSIFDGLAHILHAYVIDREQQEFFQPRVFSNLLITIEIFAKRAAALLPFLALLLLALIPMDLRASLFRQIRVIAIAFLLGVLPLIECVFKVSYPYHASLIGIGGCTLCALGLHIWNQARPHYFVGLLRVAVIIGFGIMQFAISGRGYFSAARASWDSGFSGWLLGLYELMDPSLVENNDNFYSSAARAVVRASEPGETMLTSGVIPGVFPLARRLPAVDGMQDLSWLRMAYRGLIPQEMINNLNVTPPNIVVRAQRSTEQPEPIDMLERYINNFRDDYQLVSLVPPGERFYDFIRGAVFRKVGVDTVISVKVPEEFKDRIEILGPDGDLVPFGIVPVEKQRKVVIRVVEQGSEPGLVKHAVVRPIFDAIEGARPLSEWRYSPGEWVEWEHGGRLISQGDKSELIWEGRTLGLDVVFFKDEFSGLVEVDIDGKSTRIDLYSPSPAWHKLSAPNQEFQILGFISPLVKTIKLSPKIEGEVGGVKCLEVKVLSPNGQRSIDGVCQSNLNSPVLVNIN